MNNCTRRGRKRERCCSCKKWCFPQMHHNPPKSQGGKVTFPVCRKCHVAIHCRFNHWASWGRVGGLKTAALYPDLWKRNLKQFRAMSGGAA